MYRELHGSPVTCWSSRMSNPSLWQVRTPTATNPCLRQERAFAYAITQMLRE